MVYFTASRVGLYASQRPEVLKLLLMFVVGILGLNSLTRPYCEGRLEENSLPIDESVIKEFPCDENGLIRAAYLLRRGPVAYRIVFLLDKKDYWVTITHVFLLARLVACLLLPPNLYRRHLTPFLNAIQRLLVTFFHLASSLKGFSTRPSQSAIWYLNVAPIIDVSSVGLFQLGFLGEAIYGFVALVCSAWLAHNYARSRFDVEYKLSQVVARQLASTATLLAIEKFVRPLYNRSGLRSAGPAASSRGQHRGCCAGARDKPGREPGPTEGKPAAAGGTSAAEAAAEAAAARGDRWRSGRRPISAAPVPAPTEVETNLYCAYAARAAADADTALCRQGPAAAGVFTANHAAAPSLAAATLAAAIGAGGAPAVTRHIAADSARSSRVEPAWPPHAGAATALAAAAVVGTAATAAVATRGPIWRPLRPERCEFSTATRRAAQPAPASRSESAQVGSGGVGLRRPVTRPEAYRAFNRTAAAAPAAASAPTSGGSGGPALCRYMGRTRLVTTTVKVRGAHLRDVSEGYQQRIAAALAVTQMELEGVYIREGCIELVVDARSWSRGRLVGGANPNSNTSRGSRHVSLGAHQQHNRPLAASGGGRPITPAEVVGGQAAFACTAGGASAGMGGGAANTSSGGYDIPNSSNSSRSGARSVSECYGICGQHPAKLPPITVAPEGDGGDGGDGDGDGYPWRDALHAGPDCSFSDSGLSSGGGGRAVGVGELIRALGLPRDGLSLSLECSSTSLCEELDALAAQHDDAAIAADAAATVTTPTPSAFEGDDVGGDSTFGLVGSLTTAALTGGASEASAQPPPPHQPQLLSVSPRVLPSRSCRDGGSGTAAAAAADSGVRAAGAGGTAADATDAVAELVILVACARDRVPELLIRSRGAFLPVTVTGCISVGSPAGGSDGGPALDVLMCTVSVPLAALPEEPGLVVAEVRYVGQIQGSAMPLLLADDADVATELQAAVGDWHGPSMDVEDMLLDMACFLFHAWRLRLGAAAVSDEARYTRAASEEMRERVSELGLHLLTWMGACPGAWAHVAGRLQADLAALGVGAEQILEAYSSHEYDDTQYGSQQSQQRPQQPSGSRPVGGGGGDSSGDHEAEHLNDVHTADNRKAISGGGGARPAALAGMGGGVGVGSPAIRGMNIRSGSGSDTPQQQQPQQDPRYLSVAGGFYAADGGLGAGAAGAAADAVAAAAAAAAEAAVEMASDMGITVAAARVPYVAAASVAGVAVIGPGPSGPQAPLQPPSRRGLNQQQESVLQPYPAASGFGNTAAAAAAPAGLASAKCGCSATTRPGKPVWAAAAVGIPAVRRRVMWSWRAGAKWALWARAEYACLHTAGYRAFVAEHTAGLVHAAHAFTLTCLLILVARTRLEAAAAGAPRSAFLTALVPPAALCLPGCASALCRPFLSHAAWLGLVGALRLPQQLLFCLAGPLIAWSHFPLAPSAFTGDGIVHIAASLALPLPALLVALIRMPVHIAIWAALGATFGLGWAVARAAAVVATLSALTGVGCHAYLLGVYRRRCACGAAAAMPPQHGKAE